MHAMVITINCFQPLIAIVCVNIKGKTAEVKETKTILMHTFFMKFMIGIPVILRRNLKRKTMQHIETVIATINVASGGQPNSKHK